MDYTKFIDTYTKEEIQLLKDLDVDAVNKMLNAMEKAWDEEATIYVFGNGGSASTASHMANDFNKGISEYTDKKFRITCLNDNTATVLAIANDIGYEDIFEFQLKNKVKPGDRNQRKRKQPECNTCTEIRKRAGCNDCRLGWL